MATSTTSKSKEEDGHVAHVFWFLKHVVTQFVIQFRVCSQTQSDYNSQVNAYIYFILKLYMLFALNLKF